MFPFLLVNKGFTLLEIMAAMVILAIGVLGLAPMIITAIQGNEFGNETTRATTLGQDKIEFLRNMDYNMMYSGQDSVNNMSRTWVVSKDIPVPGISSINVHVSWIDETGSIHSVQLMTYRAE